MNFGPQQISEMNTEVTRARARLAEAQARRRQALDLVESGAAPETVAQSFDAPVINELRVRLAAARQRVAELANDFGQDHPSLRAARAEAGDLRRILRNIIPNYMTRFLVKEQVLRFHSEIKNPIRWTSVIQMRQLGK